MELRELSIEQLRVEFLKANQAYVLVTFKREPAVYMQDEFFNAFGAI